MSETRKRYNSSRPRAALIVSEALSAAPLGSQMPGMLKSSNALSNLAPSSQAVPI